VETHLDILSQLGGVDPDMRQGVQARAHALVREYRDLLTASYATFLPHRLEHLYKDTHVASTALQRLTQQNGTPQQSEPNKGAIRSLEESWMSLRGALRSLGEALGTLLLKASPRFPKASLRLPQASPMLSQAPCWDTDCWGNPFSFCSVTGEGMWATEGEKYGIQAMSKTASLTTGR
jgi:hypothetical protein